MASIQRYKNGFRAFVCAAGVRKTKTFRTRREATAWAAECENSLHTAAHEVPAESHTLADALIRYRQDVAPWKRGRRVEFIHIEAFLRNELLPNRVPMRELKPEHFAAWKDARLRRVQPGTVLRELSTLSSVVEMARRELKWTDENPIRDVRKPRAPDHRDVIIHPWQLRRLLKAMRYTPRGAVRSVSQAVAVCTLTAIRTGMRAGELCGLTWDRVAEDSCFLPVTKTKPRMVPLTKKAIRLIDKMRCYDPNLVFGISAQSLDANFRKYRARAGLSGFTFHDTRHTAATMLSHKVDVLTLCKIFGWSNTSQALTYYNPTASDIARMLNR